MANDISMIRGDSDSFTVELWDEDANTAMTLTGGKMMFTVKPQHSKATDDSDAVISKTVMCDQYSATILLLPADTNIPAVTYDYDFQYVSADGSVVMSSEPANFIIKNDKTKRVS
jgi:hypothetical protein